MKRERTKNDGGRFVAAARHGGSGRGGLIGCHRPSFIRPSSRRQPNLEHKIRVLRK